MRKKSPLEIMLSKNVEKKVEEWCPICDMKENKYQQTLYIPIDLYQHWKRQHKKHENKKETK